MENTAVKYDNLCCTNTQLGGAISPKPWDFGTPYTSNMSQHTYSPFQFAHLIEGDGQKTYIELNLQLPEYGLPEFAEEDFVLVTYNIVWYTMQFKYLFHE